MDQTFVLISWLSTAFSSFNELLFFGQFRSVPILLNNSRTCNKTSLVLYNFVCLQGNRICLEVCSECSRFLGIFNLLSIERVTPR